MFLRYVRYIPVGNKPCGGLGKLPAVNKIPTRFDSYLNFEVYPTLKERRDRRFGTTNSPTVYILGRVVFHSLSRPGEGGFA